MEELRRKLEEANMMEAVRGVVTESGGKEEWATKVPAGKTTIETIKVEDIEGGGIQHPAQPIINGHYCPVEANGHSSGPGSVLSEICLENGDENSVHVHHEIQTLSPSCSAVPSTLLPSSPCASPVLAKCSPGSPSPAGYQSSYQAGINQRFHAARHKFQGTVEPEPQSQATQLAPLHSPKDLPPPVTNSSPEASPVKQLARSTVTQVLSRFTTGQPKLTAPNNSPFGTDYRNLAAPSSPVIGRAAGVLPQGVRSPTIPRADRGNPPPIPPKKPGLGQAPPSPAPVPRSASHFSDSPLSGSCGLTSSQEGVKELDMVVSSN